MRAVPGVWELCNHVKEIPECRGAARFQSAIGSASDFE